MARSSGITDRCGKPVKICGQPFFPAIPDLSLPTCAASTGFAWMTFPHALMIIIGIVFITLAITKHYEPLLLIPIGMGIIVGNIPYEPGRMSLSVYDDGSVLKYLYFGVQYGIFPPLIFLGIGAMTDFSTMLSNPKLVLLGAAAQVGVFLTFFGAIVMGFTGAEAGAIGIIGGADGPTAIFLATQLSPHLLGAIAIAAYSYMALVPVIQPPIMKLLTTERERKIKMEQLRPVSATEKIIFPLLLLIMVALFLPTAAPLLGMFCFGNLMRECGVVARLSETTQNALINIVTIFFKKKYLFLITRSMLEEGAQIWIFCQLELNIII